MYLTSPEKNERLQELHRQHRITQKQLHRLQVKVEKLIEEKGVCLDEPLTTDLQQVIVDEEQQMVRRFPEGSFQHIFWQQQKQAAVRPDKRGIRWHPLMIRWCLYLRHQSSKAYEAIRQSGCLVLPSQRTLRDYSHCVKADPGFSTEVDHQLMLASKVLVCPEWEKLVVLLLDEMYIREDLVYNKHTGELIGFSNLGDINNHLLAFERSLDEPEEEPLARSMMTFMVRGLFSPLRYPYAHFPSVNVSGDLLFQPFWEAVYRLERMGLKVRKLIKMQLLLECYLFILIIHCRCW